MKKVTIQVSFEYECEVDALNDEDAFDKASDSAMDYLESLIYDSRKFDGFWECQVDVKYKNMSDD